MDLVILAAGMGSRFGGLKQIEPIDEYGNFIIDYSIYDAKKAGFDKVIFIIKEENLDIFKKTVGQRVEKYIKVEYAFQKLENVPEGVVLPQDRVKPLGTAQAILSCKDLVGDKFIIINSDDYYGSDAFKVAANYLNSLKNGSKNVYGNIGYMAKNTITENGSVKRGVLFFDKNNKLEKLVESKIEKVNGKLEATPLDDETNTNVISDDTLVSMNMFAFTKDIMDYLEAGYKKFFDDNKDNLKSCEYLIPTVVSDLIEAGKVTCDVLSTTSIWYGVTYKEDKDFVVSSLKKLVDKGEYPKGIWK
ncbi:MAG: hypothetical protein K6E20_01785 [Acholeplasmatales bacterium]|nr:hypothetical protein [Acholeplasmatales bacterium]